MKKKLYFSLALACIAVLALFLRLHQLSDHGYFIEEVFSVLVATKKADVDLARFDAIRPLYFWFLRFLMVFGTSEVWLRMSSVLLGVANVLLTCRLGTTVASRKVGLLAALAAAISPMEIYYSQQVRMYAFGSFLSLCATLTYLRMLNNTKQKDIYVWALLRYLSLLTVPLTATLILTDAVIMWFKRKTFPFLKQFCVALLATVLLWIPFAIGFRGLSANVYSTWTQEIPIPVLSDLVALLVNMTCTSFSLDETHGPMDHNWLSILFCILTPALLGFGIFFARIKPKLILCAIWMSLPLGAMFVWSQLHSTVFLPRYLLFITPYLFILLSAGLISVFRMNKSAGITCATIYTLTICQCLSFYYNHPRHEDWKMIADYISKNVAPNDTVSFWQYRARDLVGLYYKGSVPVDDMLVKFRVKDDEPENVRIVVNNIRDKDGKIWLFSRVPPTGWPYQAALYQKYKDAVYDNYDVIKYDNLPFVDIFEVALKK